MTQLHPNPPFDVVEPPNEGSVVGRPVSASVHSPMAVRTECNYVFRMVGPAVAHPQRVVGLQVGRTIGTQKRCRRPAAFAISAGPRKNVRTDVTASLIDGSSAAERAHSPRLGSRESPGSQRREVGRRWLNGGGSLDFHFLDNGAQTAQLKHNRIALGAHAVWFPFDVVSLVDHLVNEPETAGHFLKQKQTLTLGRVPNEGTVSPDHLHVADLALAEVLEGPVIAPAVGVAVNEAGLPRHDHHQSMSGEGDYSTLTAALAAKSIMDVSAPIVDAPRLIPPAHAVPPLCWRIKARAKGNLQPCEVAA